MENVGVLRDRTRPFCRLDWFVMISLKSDATFTGSLLLRLFLYPSSLFSLHRSTMVWNKQKSRRKSWATRLSVRSFARTAHSFACSGVLASLAPSAALTRSLARSLRSLPRSWESEFLMSQNHLVLSHSAFVLPAWLYWLCSLPVSTVSGTLSVYLSFCVCHDLCVPPSLRDASSYSDSVSLALFLLVSP